MKSLEDGIDKIKNEICQYIINFDNIVNIGNTTNKGIQYKKFLL